MTLSDDDRAMLLAELEQQPYPLLFATVGGSHLDGFPSADSDFDVRGVHVLPAREVVGLKTAPETVKVPHARRGPEIDLVTQELKAFALMLLN